MDAAFERRGRGAEPLQVGIRDLWGHDGSDSFPRWGRPSGWYGRLNARRTCAVDGLEWTGAMDREPWAQIVGKQLVSVWHTGNLSAV